MKCYHLNMCFSEVFIYRIEMTVNISQVLVSEVVGKEIRCERPLF